MASFPIENGMSAACFYWLDMPGRVLGVEGLRAASASPQSYSKSKSIVLGCFFACCAGSRRATGSRIGGGF